MHQLLHIGLLLYYDPLVSVWELRFLILVDIAMAVSSVFMTVGGTWYYVGSLSLMVTGYAIVLYSVCSAMYGMYVVCTAV